MKDEFKKRGKKGDNTICIEYFLSSLNTDKTVADILEDLKKESQKQKKALV